MDARVLSDVMGLQQLQRMYITMFVRLTYNLIRALCTSLNMLFLVMLFLDMLVIHVDCKSRPGGAGVQQWASSDLRYKGIPLALP